MEDFNGQENETGEGDIFSWIIGISPRWDNSSWQVKGVKCVGSVSPT